MYVDGPLIFSCPADKLLDWQPCFVFYILFAVLRKSIPQSGGKMSKHLGGIIGCKDKTLDGV